MINIKSRMLSGTDIDEPDIFRAALNNDPYELQLALKKGQRLDDLDKSSGATPLHFASWHGSFEFIVSALQDASVDPWLQDKRGSLALDYATRWREVAIMKELFQAMTGEELEVETHVPLKPPPPPER